MTSFDHREQGTAERDWREHPAIASLSPSPFPDPGRPLLVLAAHPDDESLGAGGLIAVAAAHACPIHIIVATDGEASHPRSPTHTPRELAAIRRGEVAAAVGVLAPGAVLTFLGLPDGQLADCGPQLAAAVRQHASIGWLLAPWLGDRHPDHAACASVARQVAADNASLTLFEYPIWAWHWATPAPPSRLGDSGSLWQPDGPQLGQLRRLDLDANTRRIKQRALGEHHSQTEPLSGLAGDEAILPAHIVEHFTRPFEIFVKPYPAPAEDPAYFDRLYAGNADPWGFATRFYEQRKRDILLASLPQESFRRAFEPGCSIGLLSEPLARRCAELVASDSAQPAVEQAIARVAGYGVSVECAHIPDHWPAGEFDLIVISEVGYYCRDLDRLAARINSSLSADGVLVGCHWRHPVSDYPHSAASVHAAIGGGLINIVSHQEEDFLLDVWSRQGQSPARLSGLLG
jgi:LmbE family N-acetylglucosaminyl deacetylase